MNPVQATPSECAVPTPQMAEWKGAGWPFCLRYVAETMDDLRAAAVEGANRFGARGVEIGGMLFGRMQPGPLGSIEIHQARALSCEHAFGPSFTLSERDLEQARELYTQWLAEPELAALMPVGLYISRTRAGVELTPEDLALFDTYFKRPLQLILLLRPARRLPTQVSIFYRDFHGKLVPAVCDNPIELEPLPRRQPLFHRNHVGPQLARPEVAAPRMTVAAEPESETSGPGAPEHPFLKPPPAPHPAGMVKTAAGVTQEAIVEPPQFQMAESRVSWAWLRWMLLLACALALGAAAYEFRQAWLPLLTQGETAELVGLRALDQDGQLVIEWRHNASAVREAATAVLVIQDGGTERKVRLEGPQLRAGSLTFARRSGDVTVMLRLTGKDGTVVEEATRFLGAPVAPALAERNEASLAIQNALANENLRLKQQLDEERVRNESLRAAIRSLETELRLLKVRPKIVETEPRPAARP